MRWLLFTTTELEQPLWRMATPYSAFIRRTGGFPANWRLRARISWQWRVSWRSTARSTIRRGDTATIGDFVLAYTLDWATMAKVLDGFPRLEAYVDDMYARPRAPMRIKEAFASVKR
jgi:glutathione S-transferase